MTTDVSFPQISIFFFFEKWEKEKQKNHAIQIFDFKNTICIVNTL